MAPRQGRLELKQTTVALTLQTIAGGRLELQFQDCLEDLRAALEQRDELVSGKDGEVEASIEMKIHIVEKDGYMTMFASAYFKKPKRRAQGRAVYITDGRFEVVDERAQLALPIIAETVPSETTAGGGVDGKDD